MIKAATFYLADMPQEDKRLCQLLCDELGAAGSAMVREWYRACDEATGERINWGEVQARGVQVGKQTFADRGYRGELVNDLQRAEFFARFKTEFKKIAAGERASLPFPGSAPFIFLRMDPNHEAASVVNEGGTWYLRNPHFYPGGSRSEDNRREWRLKDVGRNGWGYAILAEAEKFACIRIMPDRKKRGSWVVKITVHLPDAIARREVEKQEVWAGIDLGLNCPAVLSIPDHPDGGFVRFLGNDQYPRLWQQLDKYEDRKRVLNRAGKREAARDLRAKITGVRQHINELISREIVDLCLAMRATGVRMEDLKGLGTEGTGRLKFWPRFHLATRIEQKAAEVGLAFEKIKPAGTSQTCSSCGHRDKGNRNGPDFICLRCGFSRHADVNAANNIARGMDDFDLPTGASAPTKARRLVIAS